MRIWSDEPLPFLEHVTGLFYAWMNTMEGTVSPGKIYRWPTIFNVCSSGCQAGGLGAVVSLIVFQAD
jgi:hypothetical protein